MAPPGGVVRGRATELCRPIWHGPLLLAVPRPITRRSGRRRRFGREWAQYSVARRDDWAPDRVDRLDPQRRQASESEVAGDERGCYARSADDGRAGNDSQQRIFEEAHDAVVEDLEKQASS